MKIMGFLRRGIRSGVCSGHASVLVLSILAVGLAATGTAQASNTTVGTMAGKFSVDPTGGASYSIPIELPPGVNGMNPNLSLNYSSHGSLGPIGYGWSMGGLSVITRCPRTIAQDGMNSFPTMNMVANLQDAYCLDGDRLQVTSGTYGQANSKYHTEVDSFQKVTAGPLVSKGTCGQAQGYGADPVSFTVLDKSGQKRTYGGTPDSTVVGDGVALTEQYGILYCQNPSLLAWPITSIVDKFGNTITFHYTNLQNGQQDAPATFYINEIDYGSATGTVAKVIFQYTSDTYATYMYVSDTYLEANPVLLSSIKVESNAGAVLRSYSLSYTGNTGDNWSKPAELQSIKECGTNSSLCYNPTVFSYNGNGISFSTTPVAIDSISTMPQRQILDLDGDGLPDYVYFAGDNTVHVVFGKSLGQDVASGFNVYHTDGQYNFQRAVVVSLYGDGTQQLMLPYEPITGYNADTTPIFGPAVWKVLKWNGVNTGQTNLVMAGDPPVAGSATQLPAYDYNIHALGVDLTGSGMTDLVFTDNGKLMVYPLTTQGFAASPITARNITIPATNPNIYSVNYDGSGIAELYVWDWGVVEVSLSSNGVGRPPSITSTGFTTISNNLVQDDTTQALFFVNANGDGLSSVVRVEGTNDPTNPFDNMWSFYVNNGLGWDSQQANNAISFDTSGVGNAQAVDWYRDGRQEVVFPSNGTWHIFDAGQGPAYGENNYYAQVSDTGFHVRGDANSTVFMDVDGDSEFDMLYTSGGITYYDTDAATPYVLSQITNGLGQSTTIDYVTSTQAGYTSFVSGVTSPAISAPEVRAYSGSLYLVRDFYTDTGLFNGGSPVQLYTYYKYAGPAIDMWGRGFLGFAQVESINYNTGIFTINKYSQTFPTEGMVTESTEYLSNQANPSPQPVQLVTGGGLIQCTFNQATQEDACAHPAKQYSYESAGFDSGNILSDTVNTPSVKHPYSGLDIAFAYVSESLVHHYDLVAPGAAQPNAYEKVDTIYDYESVGTNTPVDTDIAPVSVNVTTTDLTTDAVNAASDDIASVTTTNTYGQEDHCPGMVTGISVVDTFNQSVPATYPAKTEAFTYATDTCFLQTDVKTIVAPPGASATGYPMSLTKTYQPDAYGNPLSVTVSSATVTPRGSTMTYDSTERFPATISNALNQTETLTYDVWGDKETDTDPNGNTVTTVYDGLQRPSSKTGPLPHVNVVWVYNTCANLSSYCVSNAAYAVSETHSDHSSDVTQYSETGEVLRLQKSGFKGSTILQDTAYDLMGRPIAASKPYFSGSAASSCWSFSTYDVLSRITDADQPSNQSVCGGPDVHIDDRHTGTTYDGFTITTTVSTTNNTGGSTASESSTAIGNVLGKVGRSTDAAQSTLVFSYDPWGNMLSATPPNGHAASMVYDSSGDKLSMTDPDMGSWSYTYDALGELITQTDSKGQLLTNAYDQLGRLTQRIDPDGTGVWQYDIAYGAGIGKLAYKLAANGVWEGYAYDAYGEATDKITVTGSQEYWVTTTYDDQGRVSQLVYPDMDGVNVSSTPRAPNLLTVSVDPNDAASFDLVWQDTDQLGQIYHVYRSGTGTNSASVEIYSGPVIGWVDSTITVDDTYTWSVEACDGSGNCSAPVTTQMAVVLPPTVPGTPVPPAQSVQSTNSWSVTWAASTLGITGTPCPITYNLQQSLNGGPFTPVGSTITQACGASPASITATVTGGDGTYVYQVQACAGANGNVCSLFSPASAAAQIYIQPGALPSFRVPATAYNQSPAVVSFSLPVPSVNGGALTYTVQKSTVIYYAGYPVNGYALVGTSTTSSFSYTETQDGVYTYQVTACDTNDPSLCTGPVTSDNSTSVTLPPGPVQDITFSPGPESHLASWQISWEPATLASGTDTIYYNVVQNIGNVTLGGPSLTTPSVYSPVNNQDTTYTYQVTACVNDPVSGGPSCGPTVTSAGYTTVITPLFPGSVNVPGQVNFDGTFTATWTEDVADSAPITVFNAMSGYQDSPSDPIIWHPGGCSSSPSAPFSCTFNSQAGNTYYVHVQACNGTVCSSLVQGATTVAGGGASPPTLTAASSTVTGSETISWTTVSGTDHYLLFISTDSGGTWGSFTSTNMALATSKTINLSGSVPAAKYYVEACDAVPTCTAASATKTVTYVAPSAPTLTVTGSDPDFTLSWTASSGASSYQAYKRTHNGTTGVWTSWTNVYSGTARTYADHVGALSDEVQYYVQACNVIGCGSDSNIQDRTYTLCGSSCNSSIGPVEMGEEGPKTLLATTLTKNFETISSVTAPVSGSRPVDAGVEPVNARLAFFRSHAEVRSLAVPNRVKIGTQSASAWASRIHRAPAIDPKLSTYPPLRKDPRVIAHFAAQGGMLPPHLQRVSSSEPALVDALMIQYQYDDPAGYLTSVVKLNADGSPAGQLWVPGDMTAMGQVDQVTYDAPASGGSGTLQVDDTFDQATGTLGNVQVTTSSGQSLGATYTWDGYANLKERTISQGQNTVLDESFTYDVLSRLYTITTKAGSYTNSAMMGYDAEGDISSDGAMTYGYGNNQPYTVNGYTYTQAHGASSVTLANGVKRTYQYDQNGNVTNVYENNIETREVAWTSFNKPVSITNETTGAQENFLYDVDHDRIGSSLVNGGDTDSTVYIDGLFESEYDNTSQLHTYRHYVIIGSTRVAVETVTATGGQQQSDQLGFFVHDQVGSVIAEVTEGLGGVDQQVAYYSYDVWGKGRPTDATNGQTPYGPLPAGQFMAGATGQAEGYGSHENLIDVGVVEMEGRVYDPEIGRFLSPDPNVQFAMSTQGYGRYTYVNDNPLSLNDPSGYWSNAGFIFGGVYGALHPQQAGEGLAVVAPFFNAIPGCQVWCTAAGEAAAGYLETGSVSYGLRQGVISAISGAAFAGIGYEFEQACGPVLGTAQLFERSLAEGIVGGAMSAGEGGDFGSGFVGAFAGSAGSGLVDTAYVGNNYFSANSIMARMTLSAIMGGSAAKLTGGNFIQGAVAGAFQRMFNDEGRDGKPLAFGEGGSVYIIHADGEVEIRSSGYIDWRTNNPGNMDYGPFTRMHGAIGSYEGFAIFENPIAGEQAIYARLTSGIYPTLSLNMAIETWAPCSDPRNDTVAYQEEVSRISGVARNTIMSTLTSSQLDGVVMGIMHQEGFTNPDAIGSVSFGSGIHL